MSLRPKDLAQAENRALKTARGALARHFESVNRICDHE